MSRVNIVIQEKGGLWKTFLSIHLTAFLKRLGHNFRPVDFDLTAGLLLRVFPPPLGANVSPDITLLRNGESRLPELMERILGQQNFLIDCGANTGQAWEVLFTELWPTLRDELEKAGVKITLIVPVSGDPKTTEFFNYYKTQFPGATQIMAVVRGYKEERFPLPEHPQNLIIELPLAPPKLFATYRDRNMTMDAIAESDVADLRMDRGFARGYVPQLHAAFSKIQSHLFP